MYPEGVPFGTSRSIVFCVRNKTSLWCSLDSSHSRPSPGLSSCHKGFGPDDFVNYRSSAINSSNPHVETTKTPTAKTKFVRGIVNDFFFNHLSLPTNKINAKQSSCFRLDMCPFITCIRSFYPRPKDLHLQHGKTEWGKLCGSTMATNGWLWLFKRK